MTFLILYDLLQVSQGRSKQGRKSSKNQLQTYNKVLMGFLTFAEKVSNLGLFIAIKLLQLSDQLRMPHQSCQQQYLKRTIKMERKPWRTQEDQRLRELVKDLGISNWTLVAVRLTEMDSGIFRTGKQCRERWCYHLKDQISKQPWGEKEEKIMFQLHNSYGNHWKEITKHLENRTQNDVKNHFYASLRKGIRRMNKFIGFKKSPALIRKIRPSVLSSICEVEKKESKFLSTENSRKKIFEEHQDIYSLLIQFSEKQPTEDESLNLLSHESVFERIEKFLDQVLREKQNEKLFSEQYLKCKDEKNKGKKRKINWEKKQNIDQVNYEFDISGYLNLEPISPSSVGFQSEHLSFRSSESQRLELQKALSQKSEKISQDF